MTLCIKIVFIRILKQQRQRYVVQTKTEHVFTSFNRDKGNQIHFLYSFSQ